MKSGIPVKKKSKAKVKYDTFEYLKTRNYNKNNALKELRGANIRDQGRVALILKDIHKGKIDIEIIKARLEQLYINMEDNKQMFSAYIDL